MRDPWNRRARSRPVPAAVGLVYGARNTLREIMAEPETRLSVSAYTSGVNAYISSLRNRDTPLSTNCWLRPRALDPIECAILIKSMAWILSGRNSDLRMNNTLDRFGEEVVRDLFSYPPGDNTIIPRKLRGTSSPKESSGRIRHSSGGRSAREQAAGLESNNWAVSGTRTASGYPILANDPHLGLSLLRCGTRFNSPDPPSTCMAYPFLADRAWLSDSTAYRLGVHETRERT